MTTQLGIHSMTTIRNGLIYTTRTFTSGWSAMPLQKTEPFFRTEAQDDLITVSWCNHRDHNQVKRWFEKRGYIVRGSGKSRYHRIYEVVGVDRETATLSKLTWGGAL